MRSVIQRVSGASVVIGGNVKGAIGRGLLVLLAVEEADTLEDIEWLSGKIVRLRIFDDEQGVMNRSVSEAQGEILLISQFTLFASTKKGNRPSFVKAAPPAAAEQMFNEFCSQLSMQMNQPVERGIFGAQMTINLVNDGPVTIWIDSKQRE